MEEERAYLQTFLVQLRDRKGNFLTVPEPMAEESNSKIKI
jgi:hypothetical protein